MGSQATASYCLTPASSSFFHRLIPQTDSFQCLMCPGSLSHTGFWSVSTRALPRAGVRWEQRVQSTAGVSSAQGAGRARSGLTTQSRSKLKAPSSARPLNTEEVSHESGFRRGRCAWNSSSCVRVTRILQKYLSCPRAYHLMLPNLRVIVGLQWDEGAIHTSSSAPPPVGGPAPGHQG